MANIEKCYICYPLYFTVKLEQIDCIKWGIQFSLLPPYMFGVYEFVNILRVCGWNYRLVMCYLCTDYCIDEMSGTSRIRIRSYARLFLQRQ